MFYIELNAFKSSFSRRFFKKEDNHCVSHKAITKKMTRTNISTIAGWTFKVLNLFDARKVFRKNFNDITKINDTIENNPLLKLFTSVVNNNYCWTLAVNTQ